VPDRKDVLDELIPLCFFHLYQSPTSIAAHHYNKECRIKQLVFPDFPDVSEDVGRYRAGLER
jgi:hypothetical protein